MLIMLVTEVRKEIYHHAQYIRQQNNNIDYVVVSQL